VGACIGFRPALPRHLHDCIPAIAATVDGTLKSIVLRARAGGSSPDGDWFRLALLSQRNAASIANNLTTTEAGSALMPRKVLADRLSAVEGQAPPCS
jgi:hypothetical protein